MSNTKITHGFIFAAGGLVTIIISFAIYLQFSPDYRYIDLPEEISQARKGDTLYILSQTKDTVKLGFKPAP